MGPCEAGDGWPKEDRKVRERTFRQYHFFQEFAENVSSSHLVLEVHHRVVLFADEWQGLDSFKNRVDEPFHDLVEGECFVNILFFSITGLLPVLSSFFFSLLLWRVFYQLSMQVTPGS